MRIIEKIFQNIVNKEITKNIFRQNLKKLSLILGISCISLLTDNFLKAEQLANSSIDLKKDVENIKQDNSEDKDNLEFLINEDLEKEGNSRKRISEKTIFLKSIELSGNKKYSDEKLLKYFDDLINKDVTFSQLSNASFRIQSLYRENGFITSRVIIPRQDFLKGDIKVVILESYLEDIIVIGGNEGTRDYIKYMTSNILKDNQKDKIFKFDDLERQLLLIKKSGIGQLNSTLSKGSKLGTSILTINLDQEPIKFSAFSNTDISNNLGDYVVGLKSSYTTKNSKPLKIGVSTKYGFPIPEGLLSGIIFLEKPIFKNGLSLNSIYAYSSTKTKDLFPLTSGESINKGDSEYISLGISYPFILKRNTEFGFDITTTIQNSHQDLYQDKVRQSNVSTDRIRAVRLGLNGRRSLKRSYNTARFSFSKGFEGLNDTLFDGQQKSNAAAKANFATYKLDLSRQQYIGKKGLILELNASGQIADTPLPTPEKISFGGPFYGRGFANSHIFGDSGWKTSVQLSKNMYSRNGKSISPFVWYDYGEVDNVVGVNPEKSASTYGIGVKGNINRDTTYDLSLAVPNYDSTSTTTDNYSLGLDDAIFKFNIGLKF